MFGNLFFGLVQFGKERIQKLNSISTIKIEPKICYEINSFERKGKESSVSVA